MTKSLMSQKVLVIKHSSNRFERPA